MPDLTNERYRSKLVAKRQILITRIDHITKNTSVFAETLSKNEINAVADRSQGMNADVFYWIPKPPASPTQLIIGPPASQSYSHMLEIAMHDMRVQGLTELLAHIIFVSPFN